MQILDMSALGTGPVGARWACRDKAVGILDGDGGLFDADNVIYREEHSLRVCVRWNFISCDLEVCLIDEIDKAEDADRFEFAGQTISPRRRIVQVFLHRY